MLIGYLQAAITPRDLSPLIGLRQELLLSIGADLERADQVKTALDQLLGAERAARLQPVDDGAHAGGRGVAEFLRHEVDAGHQRAAVDPLLAGVPALDRGRVQQVLAHIGGVHRQLAIAGLRDLVAANEAQRADDYLGRRFDVLEARVLKPLRVEHDAQYRTNVELRIAERADHFVDRLLVARRLDRPSWHLRLVGDEEVIQMPADKSAASRLLHDDVENVLAIEPALVTKKYLLAIVMVFRAILEFPGEPAVGRARDLGLKGPTGEGAGGLADIRLGVVAGAETEQFEQFTTPVLVDRGAVVLVVVEPEHHCRISRDLGEQLAVVSHTVPAQ